MFTVTGNVGYSAGVTVETVTAISDYGPIVQVASTGGLDMWTC